MIIIWEKICEDTKLCDKLQAVGLLNFYERAHPLWAASIAWRSIKTSQGEILTFLACIPHKLNLSRSREDWPKIKWEKQDDSKSMFLILLGIRTEKLGEEKCMTPWCCSCYLNATSDVLIEMLKISFLDRNAAQFVIQWKSRIFPGILSGFLFVQICLPRYFPSSFPGHHHHSEMQHICQIFCSLILQAIVFATPFLQYLQIYMC